MRRFNIAIPDDAPPVMRPSKAYQTLLERAEVSYYDSLPSSDEALVGRVGDAEGAVSIRASAKFPEAVLAACPKLQIVSVWGTGTDHIDLAVAARLGITVTNTPAVSAVAMAEHALALMLAVARRIPRIDFEMRQGTWPRGLITQLHGKTLGIIGLGAIGRQTARIARGIGMRVVAWTMHPSSELARELGLALVDLDELYEISDVVSLHLRQSPETTGFIGEREFQRMKPSAIFINTARGPIADERALIAALEEKRIAGAGLDVFDVEPLQKDHPLTRLPNVVMTPHAGGAAPEVLEAGLQLAVDNLFAYFEGKPVNVVAGARGRAKG